MKDVPAAWLYIGIVWLEGIVHVAEPNVAGVGGV